MGELLVGIVLLLVLCLLLVWVFQYEDEVSGEDTYDSIVQGVMTDTSQAAQQYLNDLEERIRREVQKGRS